MSGADFSSSVAFAQFLFWVLLPVVLFGPKKWAVAAWFLMGNLDASGGQFEATASFGAVNAVKAVILPAYLIWRLRAERGSYLVASPWAKTWVLFTIWIAVASLWSAFPVSAVKAVAYLIGLLLGMIVFERSGRAGLLDFRFVVSVLTGTLALGMLQHVLFGGRGFGFETTGIRFTAFVGAQGYAAVLVALVCALLWVKGMSPSVRATLIGIVFVALFLNGSRTWALGAALAIVVSSAVAFSKRPIATLLVALILPVVVFLGTLAFGPSSLVEGSHAAGRITSAIEAVSGSERGLGSIQNVAFRYRIWNGIVSELRDSDSVELLFGHGTSSAAEVGVQAAPHVFATTSLDANRVVHNEWLRALYEWGLLGLALWTLAFGMAVVGVVRIYNRTKSTRLVPFIAYLPALAIATFTETVLVGAGSATIMGLLLLVGLSFKPTEVEPDGSRQSDALP